MLDNIMSWIPEFVESSQVIGTSIVNLIDNGNEYLYEVLVPGLNKEDLSVKRTGNKIHIKTKEKEESGKKKYLIHGFSKNKKLSLSFVLPSDVDYDNIKVKVQDGILELKLDKKCTEIEIL